MSTAISPAVASFTAKYLEKLRKKDDVLLIVIYKDEHRKLLPVFGFSLDEGVAAGTYLSVKIEDVETAISVAKMLPEDLEPMVWQDGKFLYH